ncbi:MAG: cellulase family glycosylhydrolase [Bacteroidales bacterium]|nr:cellulase family glycosylhydrolase [Bacteroidales bacterium]
MKNLVLIILCVFTIQFSKSYAYYTTDGTNIVDKETGEIVILTGFGIGGWLLPEGYMWGIRKLDRPWQFEKAIVDLIGGEAALEFWKLYHDNFVTRADIEAMKMWGINTLRIPLLASQLQPREGQPGEPPYNYSDEGFRFLDSVVTWCSDYRIGVIWDLHGAPGAQNAENIADSDGEARLWTEPEKYWPMTIDLWYKIAYRYKDEECITGYDLLNEPLLERYEHIDNTLLRKLYIILTDTIRTVDMEGIIFIEGDDWAQNYKWLIPLDWDEHLVLAFHSYPPTHNVEGLERWNKLREEYNVPLWHGETGEQRSPYNINLQATQMCQEQNVGWSWWTHKKFERSTQPWVVTRTDGFQSILDYWNGKADKPSPEMARKWMFEQACLTNTNYCEFLPEMVNSLIPLNAESYLAGLKISAPQIIKQSKSAVLSVGDAVQISVRTTGNPLHYRWYLNGDIQEEITGPEIRVIAESEEKTKQVYQCEVYNELGSTKSDEIIITISEFKGPQLKRTITAPKIDGKIDKVWEAYDVIPVTNTIYGEETSKEDISANYRIIYNADNLFVLVEVTDDILLKNERAGSYHNDGVEIYIDPQNEKPEYYNEGQFMFRHVWNTDKITTERGVAGEGIQSAWKNTDKGYVMEFAFPWKSIGGFCDNCRFMGFDVQVNDNDVKRRDVKIAWHANVDYSYASPIVFGAVEVVK